MGLSELLQQAIETLERLQIPYLVCGSVASGGYGEPRLTRDIDIVIDLRFGKVAELCEAFPDPDFFVSKDAAIEAIRSEKQFNVIHLASANKIDFMIARDCVWSRVQLERRQRIPLFGNVEGFAASPEDIVLSKMLYYQEGGSEKHLRDITGILSVRAEKLDRDYISQWATRLKVAEVWSAVLRRLEKE